MGEACGEWIQNGKTVTHDPCPPGKSPQLLSEVVKRRSEAPKTRKLPQSYKALREFILTLIGTAGFEPATPATPLQCATGLRHVPKGAKGIRGPGCPQLQKKSRAVPTTIDSVTSPPRRPAIGRLARVTTRANLKTRLDIEARTIRRHPVCGSRRSATTS